MKDLLNLFKASDRSEIEDRLKITHSPRLITSDEGQYSSSSSSSSKIETIMGSGDRYSKRLSQSDDDSNHNLKGIPSNQTSNLKDFKNNPSSSSKPPGWVHFVAGGLGGMSGAIVTAPFDLVKTRLQSSIYLQSSSVSDKVGMRSQNHLRTIFHHFLDTGRMIRDVRHNEGFRALFRGLGPTLVGTMPARAINFYVYGTGKEFYARLLGRSDGEVSSLVHMCSAITAGIATATATNPIWVVKTRLQLDQSRPSKPTTTRSDPKLTTTGTTINVPQKTTSKSPRGLNNSRSTIIPDSHPYSNQSIRPTTTTTSSIGTSLRCITKIFRDEGLVGFYRGLSASYLGVAEGTIQWILYEKFKRIGMRPSKDHPDQFEESWFSQIFAAGSAKLMATSITYPHEVIRTRLRQRPPPYPLKPKYVGLVSTFKLILAEEGVKAFYGGLSPHLLRVVPNAIVMYTVYESALSLYRL